MSQFGERCVQTVEGFQRARIPSTTHAVSRRREDRVVFIHVGKAVGHESRLREQGLVNPYLPKGDRYDHFLS